MKMWKKTLFALLLTGLLINAIKTDARAEKGPDPSGFTLEKTTKPSSFKLFFNSLQQGKTTLMLKDLDGYVLWETSLSEKEAFTKIIDLSNLPDKQYRLFASGNGWEMIQPITLEQTRIFFKKEDQVYFTTPEFEVTGEMIQIAMQSGKEMLVELDVLNGKGDKLYSEVLLFDNKFARKLDLSNLPGGTYTVKLHTPYMDYYKEMGIR